MLLRTTPPRGRRARRKGRSPPRARAPPGRARRTRRTRRGRARRRAAPSIEKSASRTRSLVGRVVRPRGTAMRRPPSSPATMRTRRAPHAGIASRSISPCRSSSASASGRSSGAPSSGSLVDDLARGAARALEQLDVLGHPREAERREPGLAHAGQLALAAQPQVDLGEPEPVVVRRQRLEPLRGLRPEQQAQRVVAAAPDAAAQLVQLGDAVALGVLDEHHGRVRDVDADLDHRRRDEHVGTRPPRTPPSPPASRRTASGRAAARRGSRELAVASRSYSAVAARAWSASDSSTSGQTTNAWRPARSSSRIRS